MSDYPPFENHNDDVVDLSAPSTDASPITRPAACPDPPPDPVDVQALAQRLSSRIFERGDAEYATVRVKDIYMAVDVAARVEELERRDSRYADAALQYQDERDKALARIEELERQLADVIERLTDAKKLARQWEYDARDAEAKLDRLAEALRNIRDDPDNKGWYIDGEALQEIARAALASLDSKKRTEWNPSHPSYDEMGQ